VREPGRSSEREHAPLSLGGAAAEFVERGAHVASEDASSTWRCEHRELGGLIHEYDAA
jgi:hypothetical protein